MRPTGTDRHVLRTFTFDVVDNALRGHAASAQLSMDAGSAVVALGFDAQALPAAFDPELVRSGFFGVPWANPASAHLVGALPSAAALPAFTTPPGVRVARPRRPARHAAR